jgi:hypothetical protein
MSAKLSFDVTERKAQSGPSSFSLPPVSTPRQSNIQNGIIPTNVAFVVAQAREEVHNVTERLFFVRRPQFIGSLEPMSAIATATKMQRPMTAPPRLQMPVAPVLKPQPRPTDASLGPVLPEDEIFSLDAPSDVETEVSQDLGKKLQVVESDVAEAQPMSIFGALAAFQKATAASSH